MIYLRKHIIKFAIILLTNLSMIACMSPIMQRHQAVRSFAFWLRHYVKAKSGNQVQMEVNRLSNVDGNITDAMQMASEIISHHSDHFNIPHRDGQITKEGIFHLLQNEWNLFHQSATPSHQPMVERGGHLLIARFDNGNPVGHSLRHANRRPGTKQLNAKAPDSPPISRSRPLFPLASGIAIGAP